MQTLLIDDDAYSLWWLARLLERCGHAPVTSCESATEAMTLLETHFETVTLVFCDLQMPDVDGVQFVRHLARIGYRGDLVLVSGEDGRILHTVEKLAQAHQIRILGALTKPVAPAQLQQVLDKTLSAQARRVRPAGHSYTPQALERAIAGGELVNHYQPKVSLASGALIGVEALVRWRHPQDGLVFPDSFIATAEEHGLIDALTQRVLTMALRQARQWQDEGLTLQMAVNISMDNLAALDFPDVVVNMADEAGVAHASLVLEVTESRLMKDLRAPLDILTRLRLKRIGLSIDDFGTGHSSLAQLRDIPFDELKLDRSFVNGADKDPSLRAIVESTLAMVRQLGMKSVAEGVEDRADWDFLRALGCDVAQGYFIARPMWGHDIPRWHQRWQVHSQSLTASGP